MSARIRLHGKMTPKVAALLLEARVLLAKTPGDAQFMQWAETQSFVHPQTRNKVKFKSLPPPEQQRIRQRWNQKAQEAEQQQQQQPQESQQRQKGEREPLTNKEYRERSMDRWLSLQDPDEVQRYLEGDPQAARQIHRDYEKHQRRTPLFTQQKREEEFEQKFEEWLKDQGEEAQDTWHGTDRKERVKLRQRFVQERREKAKEQSEKAKRKEEERIKSQQMSVKDYMKVPEDKRPRGWTSDGTGNRFKPSADISSKAKIEDSSIEGTVGGNAQVEKSAVRGKVGDKAEIRGSVVDKDAIVEGDSKIQRAIIKGNARLRGNTRIRNAEILGGSWDGQEIKDGRDGKFHDAYNQDTLDALTSIRRPQVGDSPLRAMAHYFADGGRTKGWFGLGGDLDRKKLQKMIKQHTYREYDRTAPHLGRGASFLDDLDDEQFETVRKSAEEYAEKIKARREKGRQAALVNRHVLYQITKAAYVNKDLRGELVPFVRFGHEARIASKDIDIRGLAIRTAFETSNMELRRVLVGAVVTADKARRIAKQANQNQRRYRPRFLRHIENKRFRHPETGNQVLFFSLPSQEQSRIYQEWQQSMLDWAHRRMPENLRGQLGPETRITPENFNELEKGDVIWSSMNPFVHFKVTKVDREGRRAQNPTLTLKQFKPDDPAFEAGDRHLSLAAVRNQMLEHHRVPNMGARADRQQALAQLPDQPREGWPKFDDIGLGDRRAERLQQAFKDLVDVRNPREITLGRLKDHIENALGESPPPRKAVKEFLHQLRDWTGQLAQAADRAGDPLRGQAQAYRAMKLKVEQGISRLDGEDREERRERKREKQRLTPDLDRMGEGFRSRWDAEARGKMKPIYARAMQQLAAGRALDQDFAKDLVKKIKDAGVSVESLGTPLAVGSLAAMAQQLRQRKGVNSSQRRNLENAATAAAREAGRLLRELREQRQEQNRKRREREEGPRRHENRTRLRGGGRKQMDQKAKLPSFFISKVLPEGASSEAKAHAKDQLKAATYGDLERLRKAAAHIAENWDSDFAKNHALVKHLGYDREGLKKLQRLLKRKLGDVNGRQYHDDVLEMANKYDLESEDADALYDWRVDKPARGRALSDQEKMNRFLAKAKPETRERMQGMSLADFMVMYKSILKEVLEDEEEEAQAA